MLDMGFVQVEPPDRNSAPSDSFEEIRVEHKEVWRVEIGKGISGFFIYYDGCNWSSAKCSPIPDLAGLVYVMLRHAFDLGDAHLAAQIRGLLGVREL